MLDQETGVQTAHKHYAVWWAAAAGYSLFLAEYKYNIQGFMLYLPVSAAYLGLVVYWSYRARNALQTYALRNYTSIAWTNTV
jgi:hypothetical protein